MAYTKVANIPANKNTWTKTSIFLSAGDSFRITCNDIVGINNGVAGEHLPMAEGRTFWLAYPEGTYSGNGEGGSRPTNPNTAHALDLSAVRTYANIGFAFVCAVGNTRPMSLNGVILPEGVEPFTPNYNQAFVINREYVATAGSHAGGRLWLIFNDGVDLYGDNWGVMEASIEVEEWEIDEPTLDVGDWNDKYLIFNDSIIGESGGSPRWSTVRSGTENSETRQGFRSRPLWQLSLSGLRLSKEQYDELLGFQFVNEGMLKDFLCRNARQCLFENFNGVPSLQGYTGDNEDNIFALRKQRYVQGRTTYERIYYPNWKYPRMLDISGRPWMVLPELQIYVGGDGLGTDNKGILVSNMDGFEVERNGGSFQLPVGLDDELRVDAYGGYLMRMVCNEDEIPVKLTGSTFQITGNVSFSEPIDLPQEDLDGE